MSKATLVIAILASVFCYTLAGCFEGGSISAKMDACMEKLLPGSSHDKVLELQINATIETLGKGETTELQKLDPAKINATMKQLAMRVLLCFADEFLKANPALTSIVFDCIVDVKDEIPGKREDDHDSPEMRQMEIQECVRSKVMQMCPSKGGKSKRSLVAFLFN